MVPSVRKHYNTLLFSNTVLEPVRKITILLNEPGEDKIEKTKHATGGPKSSELKKSE